MVKIFWKGEWQIDSKQVFGTPTIDIFEYHIAGDKFFLKNMIFRMKWPNCYYTKSEMYPLTTYKYGPIEVYGANNYKPYCDRLYPDWDKKIVIQIRTPTKSNIYSKKFIELPIKHLKCIKEHTVTMDNIDEMEYPKEKAVVYDQTGYILGSKIE
jgi:phosphorylcholine metabolism protein LicD